MTTWGWVFPFSAFACEFLLKKRPHFASNKEAAPNNEGGGVTGKDKLRDTSNDKLCDKFCDKFCDKSCDKRCDKSCAARGGRNRDKFCDKYGTNMAIPKSDISRIFAQKNLHRYFFTLFFSSAIFFGLRFSSTVSRLRRRGAAAAPGACTAAGAGVGELRRRHFFCSFS